VGGCGGGVGVGSIPFHFGVTLRSASQITSTSPVQFLKTRSGWG